MRASTAIAVLALAASAAPALSLPVFARDAEVLVAREPKFSIGRLFKSIFRREADEMVAR